MDYTKYVLKSREELEGLLAGKDNFFVVDVYKRQELNNIKFKKQREKFETSHDAELRLFYACLLYTSRCV